MTVYMVHGAYSPGELINTDEFPSIGLAKSQARMHYRALLKKHGSADVTYYIVRLDDRRTQHTPFTTIVGTFVPSPQLSWSDTESR